MVDVWEGVCRSLAVSLEGLFFSWWGAMIR